MWRSRLPSSRRLPSPAPQTRANTSSSPGCAQTHTSPACTTHTLYYTAHSHTHKHTTHPTTIALLLLLFVNMQMFSIMASQSEAPITDTDVFPQHHRACSTSITSQLVEACFWVKYLYGLVTTEVKTRAVWRVALRGGPDDLHLPVSFVFGSKKTGLTFTVMGCEASRLNNSGCGHAGARCQPCISWHFTRKNITRPSRLLRNTAAYSLPLIKQRFDHDSWIYRLDDAGDWFIEQNIILWKVWCLPWCVWSL